MKIRCWGTRGSIPAPGPSTLRYGGNTSCVEVRLSDGTLLILDAGSGIRPLGAGLGTCEAVLLLSHYHWDHIQGMPFFIPVYSAASSVSVLGPEYNGEGPDELLTGQMLAPYFPAPASDWLGIKGFGIVADGVSFQVGSATIYPRRLSHPGLTLGYRIEDGDRVFTYMSDNEPAIAPPELRAGFLELARGADLVLHDCQYDEAEYAARHGWGHATPRQVAEVMAEAGARKTLLFHHDPAHSDEQVELLAAEVRSLATTFAVEIAREGDILTVGESKPVPLRSPRARSRAHSAPYARAQE